MDTEQFNVRATGLMCCQFRQPYVTINKKIILFHL